MNTPADSSSFDKTIKGEDFDFDFDEDFESEATSEYNVMDAMRFDHEAGTASCNFEIDDEPDEFKALQAKTAREKAEKEKAKAAKSAAKKSGK